MKLFSKNKELSDPAIIISSCLRFLLNRISDDLDRREYSWNKPWGVKRFESIILSKFILDYSFKKITENQLSADENNGYYNLRDASFSSLFNAEFSEIGMNFEDMQEEIEDKVEAYSKAREDYRRPPECYYQIYMLITGCRSREELEEEIKKKTTSLEFMRNNEKFAPMVTQYEFQINHMKEKLVAFDMADIMLPHMFRAARQKLKNINLKKIKSLSKKLIKLEKKK